MTDAEPGVARPTLFLLALAFALAGPMLALAPLGMAPLTIAGGALTFASEIASGRGWPRPPPLPTAIVATFLLWCAISLAWDFNPADGARKLADIVLVFAAALALTGVAGRLDEAQRHSLAVWLVAGVIIGLVLLGIETIFDFPLYRLVKGDDPRLVDLLESKRSVDSLPLIVWPGALALAGLGRPWLGAGLALIFAAASIRLTASSATLGMAVSLVLLMLSAISVVLVRRLLATSIPLAFALMIPAALAAWNAGWTRVGWLKFSARHRLEIWHFAAGKILQRPFFGYGINASRAIPNGDAVSEFQAPGKPLIPLHPHDMFLQIWLELGFVGVVIATILLLLMLRDIGRLRPGVQRFALAGYGAAMIVAGLAFGIWQTWWLATIAFSAAATCAIARGDQNG
jgi:hypothetical protein